MNDIKLLMRDATSASVAVYDREERRWYEVQMKLAHRYAEYVLGLAKKGVLALPARALRQMLVTRPGDSKMVSIARMEEGKMTMLNDRDRAFLNDVAGDLDDPLSIKSLARRGYDREGDVITREGVALWPASVLDQGDERSGMKAMRRELATILSPDYTRVFRKFLDLAFQVQGKGAAFVQLSASERKALQEGSDAAGGYAVPADFQATMLARVAARSIVRGGARVIPTVRDTLVLPAFQADGTDPSIYSSGFRGSWVSEVPLWAGDDPAIGAFRAPVKKLRIGCKLSRDLVDDASGTEWLTRTGADNLATGEDAMFLTGTGGSYEPEGILTASISTTDVEGSTSNTISNTTGADGSGSKMLTLAGSLPSQYQRDAVLVTAAATEASINKLVDAQRRFLFPRERGADGRRVLIGYPVENSPHMPLEGTNANKVVLIGDLSGYVVATRSMITMILRERFADTDQLGVVLVDRVGGAVYNVDAFRAGVV